MAYSEEVWPRPGAGIVAAEVIMAASRCTDNGEAIAGHAGLYLIVDGWAWLGGRPGNR